MFFFAKITVSTIGTIVTSLKTLGEIAFTIGELGTGFTMGIIDRRVPYTNCVKNITAITLAEYNRRSLSILHERSTHVD